jgi:ribonucleoside-diphosphate reductase alpha chain
MAKVLSMHYGFALNGKVEDKPLVNGHSNGHAAHVNGDGNVPEVKKQEPEVVAMQQLAIDEGVSAGLDTSTSLYDLCPECGGGSLAYEEGCRKCYACGYSEC